MPSEQSQPQTRSILDDKISVQLTYDLLDVTAALAKVKSPEAGAVVMFAGTLCQVSHAVIF